MPERLFLVSANATDADHLARSLRDRGWSVDIETMGGADACTRISETNPFAVLISLEFEPNCACDLACALSIASVTREIPIVFVGGTPDDQAAARAVAPEARFVDPASVPWELKQLEMSN